MPFWKFYFLKVSFLEPGWKDTVKKFGPEGIGHVDYNFLFSNFLEDVFDFGDIGIIYCWVVDKFNWVWAWLISILIFLFVKIMILYNITQILLYSFNVRRENRRERNLWLWDAWVRESNIIECDPKNWLGLLNIGWYLNLDFFFL